MGILNFFGFGKTKKETNKAIIPETLFAATPMSGRKGHSGQFTKAVEKRRIANRTARLSRRANRKSKFKKHVY